MAKDAMPRVKDRSGKWLISAKGDSILHLAGVTGFTSWKSIQSEIVAPRRLPDGLIEATFADENQTRLYLIEIEAYADNSVERQLFEDILIARLEKRVIPEVICVVLKPKGNVSVQGTHREVSTSGLVELSARWTFIEMWQFRTEELLDLHDPGLIPFAVLGQFEGTLEELISRCWNEIQQYGDENERDALLVTTAVMIQFKSGRKDSIFNFLRTDMLLDSPEYVEAVGTVFGNLIEKKATELARPLINEGIADFARQLVLEVLTNRFATVPEELRLSLLKIEDRSKLRTLNHSAISCPDLAAFELELTRLNAEGSN